MPDIPPPGDGSDLPPEHWEMADAEVRKGDTEWECQECGHVTTISEERLERKTGGNLATKRCENCRRIMQGLRSFEDRPTFEEWRGDDSDSPDEPETADALEW